MPPVSDVNAVSMRDGRVDLSGREIWQHATFDVSAGSIAAILGPNGAGKSTLLKSLVGLVPLREGTLEVLGEAPRRGDARVGYMAQSRAADSLGSLTGRDYVGLGFDGRRFGWGRAAHKGEVVERALELTGSRPFADQALRTLSGGQRQRLAMAHATVFRPQLLLLDEPLAGLDLAAQAEIVDLINLVRDSTGAAVMVVAHDLNPLAHIVNQVIWVARRQVRSGPIDEVVNEATLSELYGHPIEIIVTPRGRRVIVGLEEEFAHPHPHGTDHRHEDAHEHFAEIYDEVTR